MDQGSEDEVLLELLVTVTTFLKNVFLQSLGIFMLLTSYPQVHQEQVCLHLRLLCSLEVRKQFIYWK